jgi:pimeloyl-ACP methyl ester carboxylesterase
VLHNETDDKNAIRPFHVNISIPVAVSVFPGELYQAPRSWAERAYPKLIHYNKVEEGGHFAAWEQPQLFSEELRAGFRSLRSGVAKSDVIFAKAG